jgi:alanyl-tRNA synthetase
LNEKKEALKRKFSTDYRRYYLVDLFKREGFVRKKCVSCGRFFWTLDESRTKCDDQPCSFYSFIGDSPARKKLDRVETWRTIDRFFVKNGHTSIKRYPVVARWRPDLYFTIASIIDFQRVEAGRVVFQLPANPLVVPQVCLRFNDIPSVGVSGKHFTAFTMVGQHAIDNKQGYWKDRCIDLDFELLTKGLGIPPKEITFNEDVWLGAGAFGYSLEYFVRGLEMGNAVFTAFEGNPDDYRTMTERIVDMGAGMERWAWLTQGTPTAYDANFGSVLSKMNDLAHVDLDRKLFLEYSRLAGEMNIDEYGSFKEPRRIIAQRLGVDAETLEKKLAPQEALYAIADHAQTLLFGIADGMLPSNSGGGYNLRILFRRAMGFVNQQGFPLSITDVVNWHIDYLRKIFPELEEHRDDVAKVLGVEEARYASSTGRVGKIVSSFTTQGKALSTEDLIRLYDSDGVTPEQLLEAGANVQVPEDFYEKVQARHSSRKFEEPKPAFNVTKLPPTKLLYYDEDPDFDFRAKVLKVFPGKQVVLNRTVFYPRGGGQEPDHGTIGDAKVVDVERFGEIVIHKVAGKAPKAGTTVLCHVDTHRRLRITQIHTATHILNGSSRQVLGPWVWQHSAFKEEDYGRLDITHFAHLTPKEILQIEDLANEIVRKNLKVTNTFMPRQVAEGKYGFRLYQGGVVPGRLVRVVNIGGWDIEACGGTHSKATGEVGLIKITKVERIQDGVERLTYVAGEAAIEWLHKKDSELQDASSVLETTADNLTSAVKGIKTRWEEVTSRNKELVSRLNRLLKEPPSASSGGSATASFLITNPSNGILISVAPPSELTAEQIISQGQDLVKSKPNTVYIGFVSRGGSTTVVCFAGEEAKKLGFSAVSIVRKFASKLQGSGGGTDSFAQGGGSITDPTQINEIVNDATAVVESSKVQ